MFYFFLVFCDLLLVDKTQKTLFLMIEDVAVVRNYRCGMQQYL